MGKQRVKGKQGFCGIKGVRGSIVGLGNKGVGSIGGPGATCEI